MIYVWVSLGLLILAFLVCWAGRQIDKMPEEERKELAKAMMEHTFNRFDY